MLKPGDVLLEVAGAKLDPTGQFEHPVYGRMLFPLLFTDGARPGDALPFKVLRDGERLELDVTLKRDAGRSTTGSLPTCSGADPTTRWRAASCSRS